MVVSTKPLKALQLGLGGELWHDPDLEAYATIERRGPFVRVARAGGKIYLDLVNEAWTVVEIDAAGWRVIGNPPAHFIRPRGLRALPDPRVCSGKDGIAKLQALVNLQGDDFMLYVSWIITCLRGGGPYPILVLSGGHGVGKSTAVRIACNLVDPGTVTLSGPPRTGQDLAIAANNRHVLAYDHLSAMPKWLADRLCLIAIRRQVALTGIPDLASRGDLAERTIGLVLKPITENRLTETELWAQFEAAAPEILGALLGGVAQALRDEARLSQEITRQAR
jgi:hypothetical protein